MLTNFGRGRSVRQPQIGRAAPSIGRVMRLRAMRYGRRLMLRRIVTLVVVFGSVSIVYAHFRLHWKLPNPGLNSRSAAASIAAAAASVDDIANRPSPPSAAPETHFEAKQPAASAAASGGRDAIHQPNPKKDEAPPIAPVVNLQPNLFQQHQHMQRNAPGAVIGKRRFPPGPAWRKLPPGLVGRRPAGSDDGWQTTASPEDEDYDEEEEDDDNGDEEKKDGDAQKDDKDQEEEDDDDEYEDEETADNTTVVVVFDETTEDNITEEEYKELLKEYEQKGGVEEDEAEDVATADDDEANDDDDEAEENGGKKGAAKSKKKKTGDRKSPAAQPSTSTTTTTTTTTSTTTTTIPTTTRTSTTTTTTPQPVPSKSAVAVAPVDTKGSSIDIDGDNDASLPCDAECQRFRDRLAIWPSDKPKAVIYYLIHRAAVKSVGRSIKSVERHFNRHYRYPIVVFVEPDLDNAEDRERIRRASSTPGDVYVQVVRFNIPPYVNASAVPKMAGFGKRKRTIGYRHMCRFHAGGVYRQPIMRSPGLQYGWRLDDDSLLNADVGYDLFRFMRDRKLQYGYRKINTGWSPVDNGLWDAVGRYVSESEKKSKEIGGVVSLRTPMYDAWPKNAARYFNNFEISDLGVWMSPEYSDYFRFVDRLGGIYYYKWGDAAIKTIGVTLFIPEQRTHRFKEIKYAHV